MKRSKHSEEQIVSAIRQADAGSWRRRATGEGKGDILLNRQAKLVEGTHASALRKP
jgi:hypothetical protein